MLHALSAAVSVEEVLHWGLSLERLHDLNDRLWKSQTVSNGNEYLEEISTVSAVGELFVNSCKLGRLDAKGANTQARQTVQSFVQVGRGTMHSRHRCRMA